MAFVPDRWALIRIRFHGPYVVCRLTDYRGRHTTAHVEWLGSNRERELLHRLAAHCAELAEALPRGDHGTAPVPFALFVDYPSFLRGYEDSPWSRVVLDVVYDALGAGVQPITFAGTLRKRRPAFSLPFDIVAHGASASAELDGLRNQDWMQSDSVRRWGVALTDIEGVGASDLEAALRERDRDILVTVHPDIAFSVCRDLPLEKRPRLIVAKGKIGAPAVLPPRGTAAVWFDPDFPQLQVGELLFGFVHDLPIHEAVRATQRKAGEAPGIRLFADPWTNQSLRIRDALVHLQTEAERLELRLPQMDLTELFDHLDSRSESDAQKRQIDELRRGTMDRPSIWNDLGHAGAVYRELNVAVRREAAYARDIPSEFELFEHEGTGLLPMAERSAKLTEVASFAATAGPLLDPIARNPSVRAILIEHQQRSVDIALQRLETSPLLSSLEPRGRLAAGALYRLRLHIGNPLPDSLIASPHQPIDLLLPDTTDERGHLLDVVVQGKRFTVESERSRPLRLPPLGGSDPIYFAVRAPDVAGPASLRVHLYYRNHLVQSFLLEAEISSKGETSADADVLKVTLAYTRVRKLEDAGHLQPRALSIAVNNSGSGTHELIIKGAQETSAELTLSDSAFDIEVRKFRRTLDNAARDPARPGFGRVYAKVSPGSPPPNDVAATIRAFARQGRALYEAMFTKAVRTNPDIRQQLIDLKKTRDEKIQVVRMDDTFAFPWNLLYDFTLPRQIAGALEPPVCLGTVLDAGGAAVSCGHTSGTPSICINGFWSIRHHIEELIGKGVDTDGDVTRPAQDGVRVIFDSALPGASQFQTDMQALIPTPNIAFGPAAETTLLDLLWKEPPERPSILIVVGHLESKTIAGEPDSPRVVMVPASEWLTRTELADRALNADRWTQPRPVVMLMACESFGLSASTVNDFITALSVAGAGAIIGAEAVVPAGLAMRCAKEFTSALWARTTSGEPTTTLGEAMTTFRRGVLSEGNPLAFVFNGIGSVDLTLN